MGTPWTGHKQPMGQFQNYQLTYSMHVCGLWEETGVSRENPHKHREHPNCTERPPLGWNHELSSCEATVLDTKVVQFPKSEAQHLTKCMKSISLPVVVVVETFCPDILLCF